MKNFIIESKDGQKYWISRSCAVASFIFIYDKNKNEYFVLANKRGPGTPNFQGYWNCPCGYIDFDEDAPTAAKREVFEETGYVIDKDKLYIAGVNSDPNQVNQNITIRYYTLLDNYPVCKPSTGGEEDEVDEIKWISINEIDNYEWAFEHNEIIKSIYLNIINNQIVNDLNIIKDGLIKADSAINSDDDFTNDLYESLRKGIKTVLVLIKRFSNIK